MPKLLCARSPGDLDDERLLRKLAKIAAPCPCGLHTTRPDDRAQLEWPAHHGDRRPSGMSHPQTGHERIHRRFNAEGIDELGDRPGAGRKSRITEAERSWVISLVATDPPGRLVRDAGGELEARDEEKEAHWALDALTAAAREHAVSPSGAARSGAY